MNRRSAIGALGGAALSSGALGVAPAQTTPRKAPSIAVYSQNLIRIPYPDLGDIARQIGFDAVDLTVMTGGHVDPRLMNVDLSRAFESVRGAGLEIPMISTNITTLKDGTSYPVLYITGRSRIPFFRTGAWAYGKAPIQQRLAQVRLEASAVVSLAQRCEIAAIFPNRAGDFVGQATWDLNEVLAGFDPRVAGFCFDPSQAVAEGGLGGWEAAFRLAVPRVKAIALQDFFWKKEGAEWKMQMCPLGQGMVDWGKFFRMAAEANFSGPMSLQMGYKPADEPGAMTKDLEFARKQLAQFWPA